MPDLGVNIAIIDQGKILLTKREDFEVWCLPGGGLDPGETLAQAAIREAHEETGLYVELTRLAGMYSRPGWVGGGAYTALFAATPTGGTLQTQLGETIDIRYFDPIALPSDMIWWHHRRIYDALRGVGGSAVIDQGSAWPFDPSMSRQQLYQMRDQSGLTRPEFYRRHFIPHDPGTATIEELPGRIITSHRTL